MNVSGIVRPIEIRRIVTDERIKLEELPALSEGRYGIMVSAGLNVDGTPYYTGDNGYNLAFLAFDTLRMVLVITKGRYIIFGMLEGILFRATIDPKNPDRSIRVKTVEGESDLTRSLKKQHPVLVDKSITGKAKGYADHEDKLKLYTQSIETMEKYGRYDIDSILNHKPNSFIEGKMKDNPTYAAGNVYIYNVKDNDGGLKFNFAFFGTASGENVSFDEAPRGSLVPKYKNRSLGHGFYLDDRTRRLVFSFSYKGTQYIAHCDFPQDKKIVEATRAYWVEFNTHEVSEMKESEYQLKSEENPIEDSPEIDTRPKKKQVSLTQEEAIAQMEREDQPGKTHIKKRPAPMSKEEVEKHSLDAKSYITVVKNNVNMFRKENKCRKRVTPINIEKVYSAEYDIKTYEGDIVTLRILAKGGTIKIQWLDADDTWELIKQFGPEKKKTAIKKFISIISKNVFPEEGEE